MFQNSVFQINQYEFLILNEGTFANVLGCGRPRRHEEQKKKGVVENKPLPVNSNDTKLVAGKMCKRNSN